jgi:hypothetical protein
MLMFSVWSSELCYNFEDTNAAFKYSSFEEICIKLGSFIIDPRNWTVVYWFRYDANPLRCAPPRRQIEFAVFDVGRK